MTYDPKKSIWYNEGIVYMFDANIIEYDIRDAGFSIVKQYQLLPPDKIRELEQLPKGMERHIAIGKLQRDNKELSEALNEGFTKVRNVFVTYNGIEDDDMLCVKKDAIFTTRPVKQTRFECIEFVDKNHYSSYVRFPMNQNIELFYSNASGDITVKGISDVSLNKHRLYMMDFLKELFPLIELHDGKAKRIFIDFLNDYKAQKLDQGYYLEFNNMSSNFSPVYNFMKLLVPLAQIINREVM